MTVIHVLHMDVQIVLFRTRESTQKCPNLHFHHIYIV